MRHGIMLRHLLKTMWCTRETACLFRWQASGRLHPVAQLALAHPPSSVSAAGPAPASSSRSWMRVAAPRKAAACSRE